MDDLVKPGGILSTVLDQVKPAFKETKNQIAPEEKVLEQGSSQNQKPKQIKNDAASKKQTEELVKELYGTSSPVNQKEKPKEEEMSDDDFQKFLESKTPQEQRQLIQLRKILHEEYYKKLTERKKQEERPAEKVEREEKEEKMEELKKDEEKQKKAPIAVQREQNKAEMFRGAAG